MDKLKSLWAKFKVQISFVAGCLVVATSMGTCSFDPSATSEEAATETSTEAVETTEDAVNAVNDDAANRADVTTSLDATE